MAAMKLTKTVEVKKTVEFDFVLGDKEILVKFPNRREAETALDLFFCEFCQWAKNFGFRQTWVVWPGSFKGNDNKGFCCLASFLEDNRTEKGV